LKEQSFSTLEYVCTCSSSGDSPAARKENTGNVESDTVLDGSVSLRLSRNDYFIVIKIVYLPKNAILFCCVFLVRMPILGPQLEIGFASFQGIGCQLKMNLVLFTLTQETALTQENCDVVRKMIKEDPRLTFCNIERTLNIGSTAAKTIVHNHLRLTKRFSC